MDQIVAQVLTVYGKIAGKKRAEAAKMKSAAAGVFVPLAVAGNGASAPPVTV